MPLAWDKAAGNSTCARAERGRKVRGRHLAERKQFWRGKRHFSVVAVAGTSGFIIYKASLPAKWMLSWRLEG